MIKWKNPLRWVTLGAVLGSAGIGVQARADNFFEIANGNTVDTYSPIKSGFSAGDLFGRRDGTLEPGNIIFDGDGDAGGTTYFVNFHTAHRVDLYTINLYAAGDGSSDYRDFGTFRLFRTDAAGTVQGSAFELFSPNHPEISDPNNPLAFSDDRTTPIITGGQYFRAEFTKYGSGAPRLIELQGYGVLSAVPEPAYLQMGILLALTAGGLLRRRKMTR